MKKQRSNTVAVVQQGFTLIELLVVVAVLATMAGIAASVVGNYDQQAREQLVHTEMKNIAKAVYRFKQDTGYFPKEGVFTADKMGLTGASKTLYELPESVSWLFTEPEDNNGNKVLEWRPEIGRGWNGPYIDIESGKRVSTDNCDFTDLAAFNTAFVSVSTPVAIISIEDVFERASLSYGSADHCFTDLIEGGWQPAKTAGIPYRYLTNFKNDAYLDCKTTSDGCVVLLSAGPNSQFNDGNNDDIVKVLRVN